MIHQIEFRAMGCQMSAALDSAQPEAAPALARLPGWFAGWETCLSRFQADSELSSLNRSAGKWAPVSGTLWEVFETSLKAWQDSDGLVTPVILNALEVAGYDRSWERINGAGRLHAGFLPEPVPQLDEIEWEAASHSIKLPRGVQLDFGGIAKGWAAQQAVQRLQAYGPALVNAGGDIAISGLQNDHAPWPVGVIDPFHPDADLALLQVGGGGIATSGQDYRRWIQGNAWQHHIIDPRTGSPARSDVLSATVVAPTAITAEMAAKTVLILGSRDGVDWLEAHPALAGLLVLDDGFTLYSRGMEDYLWRGLP